MYLLYLFIPFYLFLTGGTYSIGYVILFTTLFLSIFEAFATGLFGVTLSLGNWITLSFGGGIDVEWSLLFDSLTLSMMVPILLVSMLVQLFSVSYMGGDPSLNRFLSTLSLFTMAMTLLVTAENMMVLFVGWELVGLASYLLISFWFTRIATNLAALKAFLLNRIGDMALAWALLLSFSILSDWSYPTQFGLASYLNGDLLFAIALFLIVAASAKSALILFGLHTWLPQAMECPTPVSALLHAATMVTAGIFLFCRFGYLLQWCSTALLIISFLGGIGALLGALSGLIENDIKKVIAYSTVSQLGYMAVAAGSSYYSLAIFHLINHAFFKALLFLAAGAVIHAVADEQDMRRLGALNLVLPLFYTFILLGSLSLIAFPFLTGFYSKDLLLELTMVPFHSTTTLAFLLIFIAAFITALYSVRLLIITFFSLPNFSYSFYLNQVRADHFTLIPLIVLSLGSAFFGFVGQILFKESFLIHTPFITLPLHSSISYFDPEIIIQLLPLLSLLVLLLILPVSVRSTNDHGIIEHYLDYWNQANGHVIFQTQTFALIIARYWDRGVLELLGPYGLLRFFHYATFQIELLATGFFSHYAFLFLLFTIIFFIILILFIFFFAFFFNRSIILI